MLLPFWDMLVLTIEYKLKNAHTRAHDKRPTLLFSKSN